MLRVAILPSLMRKILCSVSSGACGSATMAVVVRGNGVALASDVLGVINKEHVADSVALSV